MMKTIIDIVQNNDMTSEEFTEKLKYYSKHLDSITIITALAVSLLESFKMNDNPIVKGIILAGLDEILTNQINSNQNNNKQNNTKGKVKEHCSDDSDDEDYWDSDSNTNKPFNCSGYALERLPIKKFKLPVKRRG